MTKILNRMDRDEKLLMEKLENKNKLESFLFELKEFFDNEEAKVFYDGEEKAAVLKLTEENEDWLYTDEA